MKRKLVFWTAFNSYQSPRLLRNKPKGTIHPVRTQEWTDKRIELFKRFNLPSILNQSRDDFLYLVLLDPKLRHLTEGKMPESDPRVIYCYEDEPVLEELKKYGEIVLALIDSDDMYARRAGEVMMACPAEWMYFKHGYAYDVKRGKLWEYDTIRTGPFFARRIDPKRMTRFDRDKRHPTHVAVRSYNPVELERWQFCMTVHGNNTSSHPQMKHIQKKSVDKKILEDFGIIKQC